MSRGGGVLPASAAGYCEHHRVHVFHVDGAPAPHASVGDSPEKVVGPSAGSAGTTVEVSLHKERRPGRISSFDPRHHAAALGVDRRSLLPGRLVEFGGHVFGGFAFPGPEWSP